MIFTALSLPVVIVLSYYKLYPKNEELYFINTYLNFLVRCQKPSGTFLNFIDENNLIEFDEDVKNDT